MVAIGEIVETSLTYYIAESPPDRLYSAPEFGSLVAFRRAAPVAAPAAVPASDLAGNAGSGTVAIHSGAAVYGVVAAAATASLEANRRATAFWQTEQLLRETQPQIFELLATRFTVLILAHRGEDDLKLRLPPQPPRIHGFVYDCSPDEIRQVTGDAAVLRPLLEAPFPGADDLVAAVLRAGAAAQPDPHSFLVAAGKQLALHLRDDYPRLQAILRRL